MESLKTFDEISLLIRELNLTCNLNMNVKVCYTGECGWIIEIRDGAIPVAYVKDFDFDHAVDAAVSELDCWLRTRKLNEELSPNHIK